MDPMTTGQPDYEPRYLAGVRLFNAGDYFEAHEVWEDLWQESAAPERRFYQGLIQAAVGLLHFGNGNLRGAAKLYRSSTEYLRPYQPTYLGLDVAGFTAGLTKCFAAVLAADPDLAAVAFDPAAVPLIRLDPEPAAWPEVETPPEG
jgi:hypothetical protein